MKTNECSDSCLDSLFLFTCNRNLHAALNIMWICIFYFVFGLLLAGNNSIIDFYQIAATVSVCFACLIACCLLVIFPRPVACAGVCSFLIFGVSSVLWNNFFFSFSFLSRTFIIFFSLFMAMKVYSFWMNALKSPPGIGQFIRYLVAPTATYHLPAEGPKKPIRFSFVFRKSALTIGCLWAAFCVDCFVVRPVLAARQQNSLLCFVILLAAPIFLINILLFFGIFEGLCNFTAEITGYFGQQKKAFYEDWWNSTNFAEFSRKWNMVVYTFLHSHIYTPLLKRSYSKTTARFATFLFSALLHELAISVMAHRKGKGIFFVLQMLQIPLISLGSRPFLRQHPIFENICLLNCLAVGPPLLLYLYAEG